jgi:hypothetical protein
MLLETFHRLTFVFDRSSHMPRGFNANLQSVTNLVVSRSTSKQALKKLSLETCPCLCPYGRGRHVARIRSAL